MSDWSEFVLAEIPLRMFPAEPHSPTVIVLPDVAWPSDEDADRLAGLAAEQRLGLVIPQRHSSWWLDRVEPGFPGSSTPLRFVGEVLLPKLRALSGSDAPLGVLGVGRGGQGALQAAYRWPRELPVVAAISPTIDFHREHRDDALLSEMFTSSEAARQQTATLNLHPMNWPPHQWFVCDPKDPRSDGCERLASKLRSIGIPFAAELRTASAEDPPGYIASQLPAAVAFLAEKLREISANPQAGVRSR